MARPPLPTARKRSAESCASPLCRRRLRPNRDLELRLVRLPLLQRQADLEARAARLRLNGNKTAVHAHDSAHRVQAQPQPASRSLGGKEGLEDTPLQLLRNPGTVVRDLNQQHVSRSADQKFDRPFIVNRIQSVFDQCRPHLVKLPSIGTYEGKV